MIPTNQIPNKKQEFSDGKYAVYSFSDDSNRKFRRISCELDSICVIPFQLDDRGKIKNIFLLKYDDYLLGGTKLTCLTGTFNLNEFESHYLAVEDFLNKKMQISNIDINDSYYLGLVSHSLPFSKDYRCYAIDITNSDFNQDNSDIVPIKFNKIINGEFSDSLILSCSLLLLSYFSE